mmetsp:Transcript_17383/g.24421  ORF Transcript_17383/g.24421 Transcript_17383/m.24421 type:complete len:499 (+) Transcript_17383:116-1612(+)
MTSTTTEKNDGFNKEEEWIDLMGKDLRMKIIDHDICDDDHDHDTKEELSCNVGDAVLVDFVGYRALNMNVSHTTTKDKSDDNKDQHHDTTTSSTITPSIVWERGEEFHNVHDWWIVVGDRDITPAIEMAIRFMSIGQHSIVESHSKFAHGPSVRKHHSKHQDKQTSTTTHELPPYSYVIYQVHTKGVVKSNNPQFKTPEFQIQLAKSCKTMGNDIYQNEWTGGDDCSKSQTIRLYQKGADTMTNLLQQQQSFPEQEQKALVENDTANNNVVTTAAAAASSTTTQQEAKDVLIDCLNNIAAVHLRAKDYKKAKEAATQVLLHDVQNIKGLCRAARACMLDPSSTYEESDLAIQAAEQVNAQHSDVIKLSIELKKRQHAYKTKNKQIYSKMAKAMKPTSTPAPLTTQDNKSNDGKTKQDGISSDQQEHGQRRKENDNESTSWLQKHKFRLMFHVVLFIFQLVVFKQYFSALGNDDDNVDTGTATTITVEEAPQVDPNQEF